MHIQVRSKSAVMLNNYLKNLNLVDAWRSLHPLDKEYSFYSAVHNSYSRSDLFVIDSRLLQSVKPVEYHNRLISDLSPLSLDLNLNVDRGSYSCRFDNSPLNDDSFHTYSILKIKCLFFTENDVGNVTDSVLWESFKAVIRGDIISFQIRKKKEEKRSLVEIECLITDLETDYQPN